MNWSGCLAAAWLLNTMVNGTKTAPRVEVVPEAMPAAVAASARSLAVGLRALATQI
jgi:hypothetical protein